MPVTGEEAERPSTTYDNVGVHEALHVEYLEMAPWYDEFWKAYLDKTLLKPLDLVHDLVQRQQEEQQTDNAPPVVVDVACGTGVFLKRYIHQYHTNDETVEPLRQQHIPKLIGIEPSGAMLEQAHRKFTPDDEALVDFYQGAAESLPLDNASVDILCSTNAFHFFRDKNVALQEMKRVLRPGGSLVITDWCNDFLPVKLYHNLVERLRWIRFPHRYPGPLGSRQMLESVQQAGFTEVSIEKYPIRFWVVCFWGMHTITASKSAEDTTCQA